MQFDVESGCDLDQVGLDGLDLTGANLRDANIGFSGISDANLRGADLSGADIGGSVLANADLTCAILTDVDFDNTFVGGAIFTDAIDQPTGPIGCVGTPIDAKFTCIGVLP